MTTGKKVKAYAHEEYPTFLYRRNGSACQSLMVSDPDEHQAVLDEPGGDEWVDSPADLGFPPTAPSAGQKAQMDAGRNPNDENALPAPMETGIADLAVDVELPEVADTPVTAPKLAAPKPKKKAAAPKPRARAKKRAAA